MAAPPLLPSTLPLPPFAQRAWGGALASGEWHDWRWQLAHRVTNVGALLDLLGADFPVAPAMRVALEQAGAASEVSVTPCYLALARPDDPRDPILPQVLPDPAEQEGAAQASGVPDPFLEEELEIAKGVVNRYPDRALFLLTNFCSTLCRHCMRRREWEGGFTRLSDDQIEAGVAAIASRPAIRDVLLSGGDPLNLPPSYVGKVVRALRERCDLDLLRLGSRVPVTLPMRIDDELLRELAPAAPLWLNTHFNHAREVTAEAATAVRRLAGAGVVVSNQGVLLRGINDVPGDLLDLSRALLRAGLRAYYLHHCDPVRGVRHLRVGLARGIDLIASLQGKVSGLAIPRLTVDLPGGGGKVQADGPYLRERRGERFLYESPLTGQTIEVDGSEGSFRGAGSWRLAGAAGPL